MSSINDYIVSGIPATGSINEKLAAFFAALAEGDPLLPSGAIVETFPRMGYTTNNAILVSGRLHLVAIPLFAGQVVTSITFWSGTQAAVTPTNWWFGLFDASRVALRLTADQTSTAWAANTGKTVALTSTYTVTSTGLYYLGFMMAAGTVISMPTKLWASSSAPLGVAPVVNGSADTGLTTPPALPFTAAALTQQSGIPWAYCS